MNDRAHDAPTPKPSPPARRWWVVTGWVLVLLLGTGLLLWGRLRLKVPRQAVADPKTRQRTDTLDPTWLPLPEALEPARTTPHPTVDLQVLSLESIRMPLSDVRWLAPIQVRKSEKSPANDAD